MGAVIRRGLLFCALLLLPALPCHGADPVPLPDKGLQQSIPRYLLNYRRAIRDLPCPDLARLRMKMQARYRNSGTPGEQRYYQVFLRETEKMMNRMLCPKTEP